jgi:hypothetical protein
MGYIDNNFNCFYMIMIMDMDMLDSYLVIVVVYINEYIVIILDVY